MRRAERGKECWIIYLGSQLLTSHARGAMSGSRDQLRELVMELVERHASGAQRGPIARINTGEYDDTTDDRQTTVGAAIEGAAATT